MVLHEVKSNAAHLEEVIFRHENRSSNIDAHNLACFAVSGNLGRQVWLIHPPEGLCILNNILNQ
jgi:hypothetical protein